MIAVPRDVSRRTVFAVASTTTRVALPTPSSVKAAPSSTVIDSRASKTTPRGAGLSSVDTTWITFVPRSVSFVGRVGAEVTPSEW